MARGIEGIHSVSNNLLAADNSIRHYVSSFGSITAERGHIGNSVGWTWDYNGEPGVFRAMMVDYQVVSHHVAIPSPAQGYIPCLVNIQVPERLRRTDYRVGSTILQLWEDSLHQAGFEVFMIENPEQDGVQFWPRKGYLDPRPRYARFGKPDYLFKEIIG